MTDNTVKQTLRESLSALVDGQATELELHRILKECEHNSEVRALWARYQYSSAAMQEEFTGSPNIDLSGRIQAAIANEPPLGEELLVNVKPSSDEVPSPVSRWWNSLGKVAIAASVAGLVVVGAQQSSFLIDGSEGEAGNSAVAIEDNTRAIAPLSATTVSTGGKSQSEAVPTVIFNPVVRNQQAVPNELIQKRLNTLMLEHAGNSAQNSGLGLMPFARISHTASEE